ncbi:hypothetical protein [Streptomyces sp. TLI_105]|uniref:hypothetical protein n=1 Tax=Streptomyces sp. TLI_105 TaxID=1881019 RepID=UPI000895DF8D|nr:hypothetical protein [Streptomyces sp. TLI_105]SED87131.1 hypothetical protein SAMN05428939_6544 [Streptomyces sp. TLI_105]
MPPAERPGRGRRRWALASALFVLGVSIGGYLLHGRGTDAAPAVGDCPSHTRTGPGRYEPGPPRRTDCADPGARFTVLVLTGPDGACPGVPRPGGRRPGGKLCVGPCVDVGDCVDAGAGTAGYISAEMLWTVRPCGGPRPGLWASGVVESASLTEAEETSVLCGPGCSTDSDSFPRTESGPFDFCLVEA